MALASHGTDQRVSKRKFAREIGEFRRLAGTYRARGWYLAEATFPIALVVMAAKNVKPPALVLGVRFDYTDYDLFPPSVQLVDPFTSVPYHANELPTQLKRSVGTTNLQMPGLPNGALLPQLVQHQPLMQAYGEGDVPFLCLAGVREYHEHPGHSGDAWELHRASGAGRLVRLLEIVDRYGTAPISGYNLQLDVKIAGYSQQVVPE